MHHSSLTLVAALAILAPQAAAARQPPPGYLVVKLGGYFPVAADVSSYETGFDGELSLGYAPAPGFAFEFSSGTFSTQQSVGSASAREIRVIPVTFAIRGTVALKHFEPYAILGTGAYFIQDRLSGATSDSTNLGLFLGAGANVNLTERFFFGLEGRYLFLHASTFNTSTSLDGAVLTADLGFRF
ncbi:MAG TPA: outer membrane beta-barrel protein [Anaeromyxobacter sp.]|nr:outer membrane beta-barrel protein [Anaeromyxobacter sp.]